MAYTRLGLKDGEKVYASHVSHVEDGIDDCESQITEVKDSLTELSDDLYNKHSYSFDTTRSLFDQLNDLPEGWTFGEYRSNEVDLDISEMPVKSHYYVQAFKLKENDYGCYIVYAHNTNAIYYARCQRSTWHGWYQITMASV